MAEVLWTPENAAAVIEWPLEQWHGNCFGVASALVEAGVQEGKAVYGHYHGPVAETGYWAEHAGRLFQNHGWIRDGRVIIDPTRWSFLDEEPFIHVTTVEDEEYDEGGQKIREAFERPAPKYVAEEPLHELELPDETRTVFLHWLGNAPDFRRSGVFWLANLSVNRLGEHAKPLFKALVLADLEALIPWDNRVLVLGE